MMPAAGYIIGPSLLWLLTGVLCACIIVLVPGLHIYSIAGTILLLINQNTIIMSSQSLALLFLGMVSGYAMLNTIPTVFLSVPDESTVFIVLPAQKLLMQRRGYEAVVLSGVGGLCGLFILVVLTPFTMQLLPVLRDILSPHLHWILWSVIAYTLMSEWPKGTGRPSAGWKRWWDGWQNLIAGIATFLLSGLLGFILIYRPLVPVTMAYQNLLPAFIGLFALPWVIQNLLARVAIPPQYCARTIDAPLDAILNGTFAGVMGGTFAAFFPVITAGIGSLLAGHATAQRDDRVFIISQGASKVVYYVGGLLLFFVPGLHLTRGGMAWMLSTSYSSFTPDVYFLAAASVLLAGVTAFFLSLGLSRIVIIVLSRIHYHVISWVALGILLLIVLSFTGPTGLLVCSVAAGIGLIPVLWGARRMNAMGILLLPIAVSMVGGDNFILRLLGLI
jgi:putative membrane protein